MSISDATARVAQIQSMFAELQTQQALTTGSSATAGGTAATSSVSGAGSTGEATDFATQLSQASATYPSATTAQADAAYATPVTGASALTGPSAVTGGAALSASTVTSPLLTSTQQQFASRLAADTGLDPNVVGAWLMSEENGSAAQSRMAQNNNDWLNIGYTDSATYGSSDAVWSNPITAADATAGWLKGQNTIPGYGTASAGVQAILQTAGQPPAGQIAAIQSSGWASSGYPDLAEVYQQLLTG